jgi:secondary thiamine-phosphate synthase enzyme
MSSIMQWFKDTIEVLTRSKGLLDITQLVKERISNCGIQEGICILYIPHTSASLVISENYDPSAKQDLETFLDRIAPQNESWHAHRLEGADDSPAHIRTMITHTSLTIPIDGGVLSLGRWQGIYLFEHRTRGHARQVLVRILQAA